MLEENVFANALDPNGTEQPNWRELLSADLREPAIKTPLIEAVSRRLRRVYTPLLSVLLAAWLIRLTVFSDPMVGPVGAASIGRMPGEGVLVIVGGFYALVIGLTVWPASRQAKGELHEKENADEWR